MSAMAVVSSMKLDMATTTGTLLIASAMPVAVGKL